MWGGQGGRCWSPGEAKPCSVTWWGSWTQGCLLGPGAQEARGVVVSIRTTILGLDWVPGTVCSLPPPPSSERGPELHGTEEEPGSRERSVREWVVCAKKPTATAMLTPGSGTYGGFSGGEALPELCLSPACKPAPGQSHSRGGKVSVRCLSQPSTTCGLSSRVSSPDSIPGSHSNLY